MSHGTGLTDIKAEPNLVPLLDLVFQLIMFFMICVSFVTDQVNEYIKLPVIQSARPLDKGEIDVLVANIDQEGNLPIVGQPQPLRSDGEIHYYAQRQFAFAKLIAEEKGKRSGQVNTTIIIRPDRRSTYANLYRVVRLFKQVGFTKFAIQGYPTGEQADG
jgi:biopolymer transport protein ExbD